ncbi:MAG: hypothetical protein FJ265_02425 [Planctomycetes bacterium]|nr:hypothetical protein [Planctomycetota bacterium]
MTDLSSDDLVALVRRVFRPGPADRRLAILVDLPDARVADEPAWQQRREMAAGWHTRLAPCAARLGLDAVALVLYRNAHANNADLPPAGQLHGGGPLPARAEELRGEPIPFDRILAEHQILIAPTQFSATAPLKIAAKKLGFRAATMPGFSRAMLPALKLDYTVIGARVDRLEELLDRAQGCAIDFDAAGAAHHLHLDLRHRGAHASAGVLHSPGVAGNLPSGEAYIVPYEGEIAGDPSRTNGELPVQFGEDVVVYEVRANRAVAVLTDNAASRDEARKLAEEPAYGNIAELGLGVLGDFGLEPTGVVLLDEKLGVHIAFGRSEHFGGQVGPGSFSSPDRVVHIDRVYIEALQPRVRIAKAVLEFAGGEELLLMEDNQYRIEF